MRILYYVGVAAFIGAVLVKNVQAQQNSLKEQLIEVNQFNAQATVRIHRLIDRARRSEASGQLRPAADDLAIAAVSTSDFAQRDTLQRHLHALVLQEGQRSGFMKENYVDSVETQILDQAFQEVYDTKIAVSKAVPASSGRTVLAEYITGTQCGVCWAHDRTFAALLRRYPASDVVVLAYHDGPGYPIAYGGDSLWSYISYDRGLYKLQTLFGEGDLGWIDGQPVTDSSKTLQHMLGTALGQSQGSGQNTGTSEAGENPYARLTTLIDARRQRPPDAQLTMTLAPSGVNDSSLSAVQVQVHVTPTVQRPHLAVRLVLVEDTVRVTGFTRRRLQYAAVRSVAWFGPPKNLFFPLPAGSTQPTTVAYRFDIATLQQSLLHLHDTDAEARAAFPDARTWRIQPRRLGVVAIVQDRDTHEVLQTIYQRILP